MRLYRIFVSLVTITLLVLGITGCMVGSRDKNLDSDMTDYIYEKYGIDVDIVRSEDLNGKTGFDKDYYGTNYIVRYQGYEFRVEYTEKEGFKDNYLLESIESDFMDTISDEFGKQVVRKMDVHLNMELVDDSVCSMSDLENSDVRISITVFSSGFDMENWENFDIPLYSDAVSIYVSDFKDSNLPSSKIYVIGGPAEPGVSAINPDKGDLCLYNYYSYYISDEEGEWITTEYETIELDGMTVTFDKNSNVSFSRISNPENDSYPAYHVTLDKPTNIEFLLSDGSLKISSPTDNSISARPVQLDNSFIHNQGDYRLDIVVNSDSDIVFVQN